MNGIPPFGYFGMCCTDEEEVLPQRPGDTKEEGLKILNHEGRREHEGGMRGEVRRGFLI